MKIMLDHVQIVLFSPGIIIVDKLKVANTINDNLLGLFDDDPMILPIPEEAPQELPRIQMSSKDRRYNFSVAKNRIDFIFNYKEDDKETIFPVPDHLEKILTIFQYFNEKIHSKITRCAIVTNWIIELKERPAAEFLKSKYMKSETPIKKPYQLELHYLIKDSIAEFEINKWTRIKSAQKKSGIEQNKFINLNIDINTLSEKTYEFDKDTVQKFFEQSIKSTKETIDNHIKHMGESQ